MDLLGLRGQPTFEIRPSRPERPLKIRVNGRLIRFSDELMERARMLLDWPEDVSTEGGENEGSVQFPTHKQLAGRVVADLASPGPRRQLGAMFVLRLVVEAAFQRPEVLLGRDQLLVYADEAVRQGSPTPANLRPALEGLLTLGLLSPAEKAFSALGEGTQQGRSVEDTIEALAVETAPDHVGVRVGDKDFAAMVAGNEERSEADPRSQEVTEDVRAALAPIEADTFARLGAAPPRLVLRRDPILRAGMLRLQVNQLLTPPVRFDLQSLGSAVQAELWRQSYRWLGMDDVEENLALLDDVFPALVSATLERFAFAELTRVLRGLLREGVSIIDLRAILERLLQFDSVVVDPYQAIVFDDRLTISPDTEFPSAPWRRLMAFARTGSGLRNRLTDEHGTGFPVRSHVPVIELDQQVEIRARDVVAANEWRSASDTRTQQRRYEETGDEVLSLVRGALDEAPAIERPPALLVQSEDTRVAVRELIEGELPELAVLTRSELRTDVTIVRVAEQVPAEPAPVREGRTRARLVRGHVRLRPSKRR